MTVAVPSSSDQHLSPAWPSTHTHVLPSLHSRPGLSSPLHHPLPPPRLHRPSPQKTPLLCPTQRQRKPPRLHRHSKQRHPRLDSYSQRARRSLCESSPHLRLPLIFTFHTGPRNRHPHHSFQVCQSQKSRGKGRDKWPRNRHYRCQVERSYYQMA